MLPWKSSSLWMWKSLSCDLVSFLARMNSNQRVKNYQDYHSSLLKRRVWFLLHLTLPYSPLAHPSLLQCAVFMEVWSQVLQGLLWPESCRNLGRWCEDAPHTCDRELGIQENHRITCVRKCGWHHWGVWLCQIWSVCSAGCWGGAATGAY